MRYAGATGQLTVRADSAVHFLSVLYGFYNHAIVAACRKAKIRISITVRQHASLRNLIEAIPEADWKPIPILDGGRPRRGRDGIHAFRACKPDAVAGTADRPPGQAHARLPTGALFASYSYHAFITDRDGDTLDLEADHRRHAEIENAIRDLKYGVGLNHLPSGRFPANPEPAEGGLAGRPSDGPQSGALDNAHRPG